MQGLIITTNYIGIENAEIAKERVDLRVSKGGHGIPHKDIERRYTESLDNLYKITPNAKRTRVVIITFFELA